MPDRTESAEIQDMEEDRGIGGQPTRLPRLGEIKTQLPAAARRPEASDETRFAHLPPAARPPAASSRPIDRSLPAAAQSEQRPLSDLFGSTKSVDGPRNSEEPTVADEPPNSPPDLFPSVTAQPEPTPQREPVAQAEPAPAMQVAPEPAPTPASAVQAAPEPAPTPAPSTEVAPGPEAPLVYSLDSQPAPAEQAPTEQFNVVPELVSAGPGPLTRWKEQIVRPAPLPPTPPELVPLPPHMVVANNLQTQASAESAPIAASGGLAVLPETPAFPVDETVVAPEGDGAGQDPSHPSSSSSAPQIIVPKSSAAAKTTTKKPNKAKKPTNDSRLSFSSVFRSFAMLVLVSGVLFFVWTILNPTVDASDLAAGQCVEDFFPTNDDGSAVELSSLSIVDCSQEHAYEVIAVSDSLFPDDEFPGVREAFVVGQQFCLGEYGSFIGGGQENLMTWDVWTFVPPESVWGESRVVQCLVGDATETNLVTGTLRDVAANQ